MKAQPRKTPEEQAAELKKMREQIAAGMSPSQIAREAEDKEKEDQKLVDLSISRNAKVVLEAQKVDGTALLNNDRCRVGLLEFSAASMRKYQICYPEAHLFGSFYLKLASEMESKETRELDQTLSWDLPNERFEVARV